MAGAPKRWNEISSYLEQALTLDGASRSAWLEELRRNDADLADQLEALLQEHRELNEERFLEDPLPFPAQTAAANQTVGPYRLIAQLGQGGMSTVWAAERVDGRFEGRVAIKFLNFALHGRTGQVRFAREGSILGRFAHPHIARLMDAGVSAAGQPYLILEYIEGEPIDEYCAGRKLTVEARLRLFLDVLDAIAHAHANLIVHRDIKPSNVLITCDGQVKVLDFGIAKLLEGSDQNQATLLTNDGGAALTPLYAAPEQLTDSPITTATDVYTLGVLLYLLLTGRHPAGGPTSPAELVKAITTTEPRRMSDVVTKDLGADEKLWRVLRGDLDTIVAKAVKKRPEERYSSVTAFADDIRRYLSQQPITARPDTFAYRAAMFVRRNRTAVALAALAFVAAAGGVAGTLIQARRARAERDFAFRQLARTEAINDLQHYVLSNVAPAGKPFTLGDVLSRAEHVIRREQVDTPTRVRLLLSIGGQYKSASQYQKAQQLLEEAYSLSKNVPEPALRASAACQLGQAVSRSGDSARAEALWRDGLSALPDDSLYALDRVSCWVRGSEIAYNADRAKDAVARALTARKLLTESPLRSDPDDLDSAIVLASAYGRAGMRGEAIATYRVAEEKLKILGRDDTKQAAGMFNNWAVDLLAAGQPLQAEVLLHRTIDIEREGLQENTVDSTTLGNCAVALYQLARFDEAAAYADQAYTKAVAAGDEMATEQAMMHRARASRAKGDVARSVRLLTDVEARMHRKFQPASLPIAALTYEQALNAQASGDLGHAQILLDRDVDIMETLSKSGRGSATYEGRMLARRSEVELQLGRQVDALADAQRALPMLQTAALPGSSSADVGRAYVALGRAWQAQGKEDQARAAFRSASENLTVTLGKDHPEAVAAMRLAGVEAKP